MPTGKRKPRRVTGQEPLSYMGVEATTPPQVITSGRYDPTVNNYNFDLGTIWVNWSTNDAFILVNIEGNVAEWVKINNQDLTVNGDTGSAVSVDDEINIIGNAVLETTGSGDTLTIGHTSAIDGQLIIAATGLDPAWATVTSSDGTITITGGANTLDITRTGGGGTTDFITDAGTANSVGSQINIYGGTNINTAGAGMTVTVNLDNTVTLSGKLTASDLQGTNLTTGVLSSDVVGDITSSAGTNGQLFIGSTGAAPAWANLTSTSGSIVITEGANSIDLDSISDDIEDITSNASGASPTAYTLQLSDLGKFILFTSAGVGPNFDIVVEIPPNSSVAFPIGSKITVVKVQNAGNLWFKQGAGVTIKGAPLASAATIIISPGNTEGQAFLTKTGTDEWYITGGDISGSANPPPY